MKHTCITTLTALLLAPLVALAAVAASKPAAAKRPNVILILADDLGWADLGCYGGEIKTPNLDGLAAQGLRFTQFYNSAKCEVTRASLMSGLYWQDAGLGIKRGITMGQAMRAAGYATFAVGKWHLDGNPVDRGFDHYFGHLSGASDYFAGNPTHRLDHTPFKPADDKFYTTDANAEYAIRFLEESRKQKPDQPFFMYLAFNAPHAPLQAWPEDIAKYRGKYRAGWDTIRQQRYQRQIEMGLIKKEWALSPRPETVPAWDALTDKEKDFEDLRMSIFAAMVDRMDQAIGRVLAKVKALGVADETLVLFLSDNGGSPYDRGRRGTLPNRDAHWEYGLGWANTSVTPFRHYKRNMYAGGACTPFIASWPNGIPQRGAITDQRAHIIDLMATIVDLGGWTWPTQFEGKPLPTLAGKSLRPIFAQQTRDPVDPLYFQLMNHRAIISGPWKLASDWGQPWALFQLDTDRTELHDLLKQEPEPAQQLEKLWETWAKQAGVKPRASGGEPAYRHLDDPREITQAGNDEPDQIRPKRKAKAAGNATKAKAAPTDEAPLAGPAILDFTFDKQAEPWKADQGLAPFQFQRGALITQATAAQPTLVLSPCQINTRNYKQLCVRLSIQGGNFKSLKLWWTATGLPRFSEPKSLSVPLQCDGQFHDYVFALKDNERWQNKTITALKLELTGVGPAAEIQLQSIKGAP
jgi:arylsulfatase